MLDDINQCVGTPMSRSSTNLEQPPRLYLQTVTVWYSAADQVKLTKYLESFISDWKKNKVKLMALVDKTFGER